MKISNSFVTFIYITFTRTDSFLPLLILLCPILLQPSYCFIHLFTSSYICKKISVVENEHIDNSYGNNVTKFNVNSEDVFVENQSYNNIYTYGETFFLNNLPFGHFVVLKYRL